MGLGAPDDPFAPELPDGDELEKPEGWLEPGELEVPELRGWLGRWAGCRSASIGSSTPLTGAMPCASTPKLETSCSVTCPWLMSLWLRAYCSARTAFKAARV